MKVSLQKNSPFRIRRFPWFVYGFFAVLSIALIIVKQVLQPELLTLPAAAVVIPAGLGIGVFYAFFVRKKVTGKRNYLATKQGMAVAWGVSAIGVLMTVFPHWTYYMCVFIVMMNIGFFAFYIPRFIEIRQYLSTL